MKSLTKFASAALTLSFLLTAACSTSSQFRIPEGHTLMVTDRQVNPDANGTWETSPFFWSETGGAPYRLIKDGKVVRQGKLKTHFRVASIFWPPFALIYWPMGLHKHGFDLTRPGDGYYVVDSGQTPVAQANDESSQPAPAEEPKAKKKTK